MSSWSQIDDLRDRVAKTPVAEVPPGESGFTPERLVVLGWELFLSRRQQGGVVRWHLSAKLYPHGRSSTKSDWQVVGRIAARVGAPPEPVLLPPDPRMADGGALVVERVYLNTP